LKPKLLSHQHPIFKKAKAKVKVKVKAKVKVEVKVEVAPQITQIF
jgi:hypothetical protein